MYFDRILKNKVGKKTRGQLFVLCNERWISFYIVGNSSLVAINSPIDNFIAFFIWYGYLCPPCQILGRISLLPRFPLLIKNWLRELHRETFHNSTSCNRCKNRHISNKTNKISTWVAFLWYLVIINHNQCKYLNGLHIFFQSMIKVYGAQ